MEILKLAQVQKQLSWGLNQVVLQQNEILYCTLPLGLGPFGYILTRDVCRMMDTKIFPSLPRHWQLMGHASLAPGEGNQREEYDPSREKRQCELREPIILSPVLDNQCSWVLFFFFFLRKHRPLSPIPDYPSSAHRLSPRPLDFLESIQVALLLSIHRLMSSQNLNWCDEGELMISHISPSCHWTAFTITKLLLYDETKFSLWLLLIGYFSTPWKSVNNNNS